MGQNEQRSFVVAIVALAFASLAVASAPRWAACIGAALAMCAVVPLASSRRELRRPRPLLLLVAIPLLATALQLLPLPTFLVEVLSPARYDLAVANAQAYGYDVPWAIPLSQDWPGTLVELAKFSGYFAFAYVCTRLCVASRARRWLLMTVCCVATVVALCALGHRLLGSTTLLGIYTPASVDPRAMSPFLNANHLAGYLAFAAPLCLGLAAERRSWFLLVMAGLCASTSVQAVSRGAIVSLGFGLVVTVFLLARSQGKRKHTTNTAAYWVALAVGAAFIALAVFWASAGQQLLDLDLQQEQDTGKFMAWQAFPSMVAQSPWAGIGRGAFEFAFTRFQPPTGLTFSHIENEYLQVIVDWGIPTALAIAVAVGLLFRAMVRRGTVDAMTAGSFGAIAALLVQNSVDFGLQLPGMALPAIAVVASLVPGKLVVQPDKARRKITYGTRLLAVIAGVLLCALAAASPGARPSEDMAAAPELAKGFSGSTAQVLEAVGEIAQRHPADYQTAARAATILWERQDPKAFSALARALELNSSHAGVHLLAAEMLASSQQPRQAIAEYRVAMAISGVRANVLKSMEAHFPAAEDLILAAPEDALNANRFGVALLRIQRPDAAEAFAKDALRRGLRTFGIYKSGVRAAVLNKHFSWAVETARTADNQFKSEESLLLYISALRAASLLLLAIEVLEARRMSGANSLKQLDILSLLQLEVKDLAGARKTAESLLAFPGLTPQFRQIAHDRLATVEEHLGNKHQADWHRQQAASIRKR